MKKRDNANLLLSEPTRNEGNEIELSLEDESIL